MIYKTYEEQIEILKSRNLKFIDENIAIKKLSSNNYYNIINGYKKIFLSQCNPEVYFDGCTFEEIFELYDFDRNLRNIIFKAILQIENTFRTQVAHTFAKHHSPTSYMSYDSFETLRNITSSSTISDRASEIYKLTSKLQNDISRSITQKEYVSHYISNHGCVPIWVFVNTMTLGRLSSFYKLMNQRERVEISKYWDIQENILYSFVKYLAHFRNLCAHDERIYCAKSNSTIPNTDIHTMLSIPVDSNNNYISGKNDLYALLIVCKSLLPLDDFNTMFNKISGRLRSLETKINSIPFDLILVEMGFPSNWKNIKTPIV